MVLLISAVFLPEPVVSASVVYDLANFLSEKTEIKVLSPKPSRPLGFSFKEITPQNDEFEHVIVDSFTFPGANIVGRMIESFSFGRYAANYIKKHKFDIKCIYVNSWPLLAEYQIVRAAKAFSIPVILHVQDIYPEALFNKVPNFGNLIIKVLLPLDKYIKRNVNAIITISPSMRLYLKKSRGLEDNIIKVVNNWQNEEKFTAYRESRKTERQKSKFTFMFLGNLNKTAGIDLLINSFEKSGLRDSRLVIAGNGSERDSLLSMTKRLNGLNIEFMDAPVIKVPEIQDKADVLILSVKRGAAKFALPSKLPAYMFSAKPIIACVDPDSDTAKAIRQADCGWVVPPEDMQALSQVMITSYLTPFNELMNYGMNGLIFALGNYSKKVNLKELGAIILSKLEDCN